MKYKSASWSINILDDWGLEESEDCVSIFSEENGVGVLQISSAKKEDGEVSEDDLIDITKRNSEDIKKAEKVVLGDFQGFAWEHHNNNEYWRKLTLYTGKIVLFITYNCDSKDKDIENAEVDKMLHSLRLEG